jgi:UDP-N-acetylmuramoyl-L-alanyl-D-glutamate--2,6-diaminopimelate ligase
MIPTALFRQIEPIGHLAEAVIATTVNGFPAKKLRIIGVTGTNGKTTTSFMIHRMLHEAGIKVALLTTVANGIGDEIVPQQEHITTAQAGVLQRRLKEYAKAGVEWVVLETSSHALAQHRVWGVPYEIAVMTNITYDHLDYHGTFERYLEAKQRLFKLANKNGLRYGVANADDPHVKQFTDFIANYTTYGIKSGDIQAQDVELHADGSTYKASIEDDSYAIRVNIPGEFNVSNSLAALSVGRKLGLAPRQIEQGIAALTTVEGRMNVIDEGQAFKVIIDFASTPDAFTNLFESIRPLAKGKLIAVFGSAGRRDEAKRSVQGEIAGKYADVVIATEEDDRDIDGMQILQQIASGAEKSGKRIDENLYLIRNREEAIGFAMTQAESPDDVVVLLGKGHEKTIERANGVNPWSESEVARAALQALAEEKS